MSAARREPPTLVRVAAQPLIRLVGVGGGGACVWPSFDARVDTEVNARADAWADARADAGIDSPPDVRPDARPEGVDRVRMDTDAAALAGLPTDAALQLGRRLVRGRGTDGDHGLGWRAALADRARIRERLEGADLLVLVAGTGGGTGGGAGVCIARIARAMGLPTLALVSRPDEAEGLERTRRAESAIAALRPAVETLVAVSAEEVAAMHALESGSPGAFRALDDALGEVVSSLVEPFRSPGPLGIDLADLRRVLRGQRLALTGSAGASGAGRATRAVDAALASPLLEGIDPGWARGMLASVAAAPGMRLGELDEVAAVLRSRLAADAALALGTVADARLGDELRVTLLANGLDEAADDMDDTREASEERLARTLQHGATLTRG